MNLPAPGVPAGAPRVGLCGFTMSMRDYGRYFPVVEVQSTFYDPPDDALLEKWRATTPPELEYTMKVWQLVTHPASSPTYRRIKRPLPEDGATGFFRDTPAVRAGWRRSVECAQVLAATAMLFQCPASFRPEPDNIKAMVKFFTGIERPRARLLWEPRGKDWIAQRDLAIGLCRDLDVVHVVDPFVTPPAAGVPVYWRLHGLGGPRHSYTDAELHRLRSVLLEVSGSGVAYVLFNNLPRVRDAKRFLEIMAAGD